MLNVPQGNPDGGAAAFSRLAEQRRILTAEKSLPPTDNYANTLLSRASLHEQASSFDGAEKRTVRCFVSRFGGHERSYFFRSVRTLASSLTLEDADPNELSACISRVSFLEIPSRGEREREGESVRIVFAPWVHRSVLNKHRTNVLSRIKSCGAPVHRRNVFAYRPAWNSCRRTPYPATRPPLSNAARSRQPTANRAGLSGGHTVSFMLPDFAPSMHRFHRAATGIDTRLLESRG